MPARSVEVEDEGMALLIGLVLIVAAIVDGRHKHVPIIWMAVLFVLAIVSVCIGGKYQYLSYWLGIVPGILLILTSLLTRGQIGMADGIVLMALGLYLGWFAIISLLFVALLLAAVWCIVLLIGRRAGRRTAIAFVPFICIAYGGVMFFG